LWIGQWADLVVRNVNITTQSGTAFFNKGRNGVDRKYKAIYAYLADARPTSAGGADDINYIKTFGAMQFLGIQHKGLFYNPDKPDTFITMGRPVPRVNYNFWNFTASSAEYTKPAISNAQALYDRMRYDTDSSVLLNANGPVNGIPANWLQLITAGPVVTVNPGDTVNYIVAYIAAKNSAFTTQNNYVVATNESLKDMQESFKRCRVTYLGENVYEDGIYRPELDLNGNGKLDQYIVPEAPASPRMRVVPGDDKVEVYWDGQSIESIDPVTRKKDFEGYRLYRTNEGDDLRLSLADERNLIGQWDSAGNNIGYNNGFDAIRLTTPKYFDGDTTPYIFKYETNKVKNGWQYLFVLTAFDKGDDVLGIESLESSFNDNATYVFPGTGPRSIAEKQENVIGVYPNPYRTSAAWDGQSTRTHKIYFYNLPAKCEIAVYTSSGDLVAVMQHDASTYKGEDSKWYEVYSDQTKSVFSGGEHAWDILSSTKTTLTTGVYLFTVKDKSNDRVEVGKFTIIK
jgi:hypothetical protein